MTNAAPAEADLDDFLGQTRRQAWWQRRIVWIPLVVLAIALLGWLLFLRGGEGPAYVTEVVERRSLDLVVTATGNLRPTNQVEVGSEVSGRIDEVNADVNDTVTRGEVLARINTDFINEQITQGRAALNAARAQVEQARATLEVDTAQLERFREVFRVSDGRVPSQQEIVVAEGAVRRDRAALASAEANVASAQATLTIALTNLDRSVIRAPVSGMVLARQVEPGQTVVAAFNAPVLLVLAEDLAVMQLRVNIDEADVGRVVEGQPATFTVDAYPGREFPAVVERVDLASGNISLTAEQQGAQTSSVVEYEARLTVDNSSGLLRPGMTATATIATDSTAEQLVVPNAALRFAPPDEDDAGGMQVGPPREQIGGLEREEERASIGAGSRQTVHVLQDDGALRQIIVTTGLSDGRFTAVTSDELEAEMRVVTAIRAEDG